MHISRILARRRGRRCPGRIHARSPRRAAASTKGADLRVVNTAGKTLAEFRQYTGPTTVKTRPGANCFGQGTGGSGDRVTMAGATALGIVRDALGADHALRPLSVTDAFVDDGFGLGVCGIGGFTIVRARASGT